MSEIRRANAVFQHQADAVISQANPVSTTLYEVLATTKNVRIIGIGAVLTWATTQPNPLEILVTIDGVTVIFNKQNPVTATSYYARIIDPITDIQYIDATIPQFAFLLEGRSVKVEVRVTWATTQPTPLVCRVKWAKIP